MKSLFVRTIIIFTMLFSFSSCVSLQKSAAVKEPKKQTEPKTHESTIHDLIRKGNLEATKELFQLKTDVNLRDEEGNTPLHVAASIDDVELCSYLLSRGAVINAQNNLGETPLLYAVKNNASKAMLFLIEENANIFITNNTGMSVADYAAKQSEVFLDTFISQKTGNARNVSGESIVHYFVKAQNLPAIDISIAKKIPLSVKDNTQKSPLELAFENTIDLVNVQIAAKLIMGNAEPLRKDFAYFETAIKTRNINMRFEDAFTPLHIAVQKNHAGIVKYLIDRKVQVSPKNFSGVTPLHYAVQEGNLIIINDLLAAGADVNARDMNGRTILFFVYPEKAREKTYDLLLSQGANPNIKDLEGETPLHFATRNLMGMNVLTKLINAGADFNERNIRGETPLALAVENNLIKHASYFVEMGSDINNEDIVGFTPLLGAYSSSLDMVKAIIRTQNISSRNLFGNTPLHIAAEQGIPTEYLEYLYSCGAVIDARNVYGNTPLHIAVQNNQREIGLSLLARGADFFYNNSKNYSSLRIAFERGGDTASWMINATVLAGRDNLGNSALHYAADWKFDRIVSLLIERGADVNAKNSNGETPIFFAVRANSPSIVQIFLSGNADKNARDLLGNTPLHTAALYLAESAAKLLIINGADINAQNLIGKTPLGEAARRGIKPMITLYLENGANVNASDSSGKTVLMDAVQNKKHEIVVLLFKYGADGGLQDIYGRNVYHEAVLTQDIELIRLIKSKSVNPLSRDSYGKTPLSFALQTRDEKIIDTVLPSDTAAIDSSGNTPVHIGISEGIDTITLKQIVDRKYPINRRNSEGITPLLLAIQKGMTDQAVVLLNANADPFIADNLGNSATSIAMTNDSSILFDIVRTNLTKVDSVGDGVLHYAARYADQETVNQLVIMGLSKTARNISGETPEDIAKRWMRNDIVTILANNK